MNDMFFNRSGVLTTYFYEDEFGGGYHESTPVDNICSAAVRKYSDVPGGSGKVYIMGSNPAAALLALDGDILDNRIVRRQTLSIGGFEFTVRDFRKVYLGDALHHCEIELA